MKKVMLSLLFLVCVTAINYAQNAPKIKFSSYEKDFGTINEADGSVSYTFEFTNTGNAPLKLTKVEPSCSCITLEYTKTNVAPGAKGTVKATFNPYQRKDAFQKRVYITSNAGKDEIHLVLKGVIVPKP